MYEGTQKLPAFSAGNQGYGTEGNLRHKLVGGSQLRNGYARLGLEKGSNVVQDSPPFSFEIEAQNLRLPLDIELLFFILPTRLDGKLQRHVAIAHRNTLPPCGI